MSNAILEIQGLSKSYNNFNLRNVSFTLERGYIMGLVGPNGAGKTTTLNLILNMIQLSKTIYLGVFYCLH